MDIYELKEFLQSNVPNFQDPEVIEDEREFYHYTSNWNLINESGVFKGAKIDSNLDYTQQELNSPPATQDLGVVFAYENFKYAEEEGFRCDVVKIKSKKAIKVMHHSEDRLGELTKQALLDQGITDVENETPHTILILTTDILEYSLFNKA